MEDMLRIWLPIKTINGFVSGALAAIINAQLSTLFQVSRGTVAPDAG